MIKKLTIENIQSHKLTELEFDKGMNVITGPTDSGKSTIVRSLRLVNFNEISGSADRIVSDWKHKGAKITEELFSGEIIKRVKGTENAYYLGKQKFVSFKTSVPEDIKKAINLSDVNLQQQHDHIYLIGETHGEIAKHFNKIANIDKIDNANKSISSEYLKTKQLIEIQKSDLKEKKTLLKSYEYLEQADELIIKLEKLEIEVSDIKKERKSLKAITEQLNQIEEELKEIPELQYEDKVNNILKMFDESEKAEKEYDELLLVVANLQVLDSEIEQEESLTELENIISEVLILYSEIEEIEEKQNKISQVIESISKLEIKQNKALKSLEKLEKKFEKHMVVCPLCNTKLK